MQIKSTTPLWYASTLPGEAGDYTSTTLADLCNSFKGGTKPTDFLLFTEESEAINAARRIALLREGREALDELTTDQLVEIVPQIDRESIGETLDRLNHYCD